MTSEKIVLFRPYPFEVGQKIRIDGGPRGGDWEVIGISERKVEFRCPVTRKEVNWDRFCYFVSDEDDMEWPEKD
jgi:hypothetical protein